MTESRPTHRGISPSTLTLYQSCQRKYYWKKVAKVEIDPDQEQDTEALKVGTVFHAILEEKKHELEGLTLTHVKTHCGASELDTSLAPMIFAMLANYKAVHEKVGMVALACEIPIETDTFYGVVDVVLAGDTKWWICDMKTAGSYMPGPYMAQLQSHPQLNLYAAHAAVLAETLNLSMNDFGGVRIRLAVKSRIVRKANETDAEYFKRLKIATRVYDFEVPKERLKPDMAVTALNSAAADIANSQMLDEETLKEPIYYNQNFSACMNFMRPCEYFSRCHGELFSKAGNGIACVSSEA